MNNKCPQQHKCVDVSCYAMGIIKQTAFMKFVDFLKSQLVDFVYNYKKYFTRTLGIAITYASVCFVIAALLFRFSNFDRTVSSKQISLLSYFFHRYSKGPTYSIVDLIKTVFIFFVCLFSVALLRIFKNGTKQREARMKDFLTALKTKDFLWLFIVFVISSMVDFGLVEVANLSTLNVRNTNADIYIQETLFHLRIYIPLMLFSLAIWNLVDMQKPKITLRLVLFLYISLWLFNEFAYELSMWVRGHVFGLALMPFRDSTKFY